MLSGTNSLKLVQFFKLVLQYDYMSNAFSLDQRDAMRLYNKLHMDNTKNFSGFA